MKIGGMVENTELTLYRMTSLKDQPGMAGAVLKYFASHKINLEYITESSTTEGFAVMAVCVHRNTSGKMDQVLNSAEALIRALNVVKTENVCVIGIYGPHFREKHSIAAKLCMLFGKAGVNILGMSSSISSICCVINETHLETARLAILGEFELP